MKEEKVLNHATVCFPVKDGQIMLGIKTRKIGEGCWNGYGGGVEAGERVKETAIRELAEETGGIKAGIEDLEEIAIVDYHNTKSDGTTFECRVHFYLVTNWSGVASDTSEMIRPTWFAIDALPLEGMMLADKEWLPLALRGKKLMVKVSYGPFHKTLLSKVEVQEVDFFSGD